jgi:hypothetical protein
MPSPDNKKDATGSFSRNWFENSVRNIEPSAENFRIWAQDNKGVLKESGWLFEDHPRDPKLYSPEGHYVDVIRDAGGPNPAWQWFVEGGPSTQGYEDPMRIGGQGEVDPMSEGARPEVNHVWDEEQEEWRLLRPDDPGYDPSWGLVDKFGDPMVIDPLGDTKYDKWLRGIYEREEWDLPDRAASTGSGSRSGGGAGAWTDETQPEYRYYGTDPNQDWDVDQSWLREAPPFWHEPWVGPEEFTFPGYEPPPDFSYPEFAPPSADEVLTEDPGYQFRRDEGLRAMEASAASRGTLRGGGTIKGLIDYGSNVASQEYEKAHARLLMAHRENRGAAAGAYAMNLGAGQTAYGLQRENAMRNELLNRESAFRDYTTNYQRAQDILQPKMASWDAQQAAARSAAKALHDRQWQAYTYSQPSGSDIYKYIPGGSSQSAV